MKKTTLVLLAGLALFLAGCGQQTPTQDQNLNQPAINQPTNQNQNINQPAANLNQNNNQAVNINKNINTNTNQPQNDSGYLNYKGSKFELSYPSYLKTQTKTTGVRTTVTFSGTKPANEVESLISVSTMPNQSGVTLSDYSQEIVKQGPYVKSKELTVDGVLAYELVISESGAGPRYLFLSRDGQTIYDLTIQNFDSKDKTAILASFSIK